jgi:hypothetical protein
VLYTIEGIRLADKKMYNIKFSEITVVLIIDRIYNSVYDYEYNFV